MSPSRWFRARRKLFRGIVGRWRRSPVRTAGTNVGRIIRGIRLLHIGRVRCGCIFMVHLSFTHNNSGSHHRYERKQRKQRECGQDFKQVTDTDAVIVSPVLDVAGLCGSLSHSIHEETETGGPENGEDRVDDYDVEGRKATATHEDGGDKDVKEGRRSLSTAHSLISRPQAPDGFEHTAKSSNENSYGVL